MSNTFLSSDLHIGHRNIIIFTDSTGAKIRNFESLDEHDEYIITKHNSVVGPKDTWFCLGDVVMNKRFLYLVDRMNGAKKILIAGNHDEDAPTSEYLKYFDQIYGCKQYDEFIFTHIPVHSSNLRRFKANIHGHLHNERIHDRNGVIDPRYRNVSLECLNDYTPIAYDDLKKEVNSALDLSV